MRKENFQRRHCDSIESALQLLKWQTATASEEDRPLRTLGVDFFKFVFNGNMDKDAQYQFVEYLQTLNLANTLHVIKAAIWLMQHNVDFDIKFRWCKSATMLANLKSIRTPGYLMRELRRNRDTFMNIDLDAAPDIPNFDTAWTNFEQEDISKT